MGYDVKMVDGNNGAHKLVSRVLEIGQNLPLAGRLVTLAHEAGHALDLHLFKPSHEEILLITESPEVYANSRENYNREKSAWKLGRKALIQVGALDLVREEFVNLRRRCLSSYYYQYKKSMKQDTKNNSQET